MNRISSDIESKPVSYAAETAAPEQCVPELVRRRACELFEARGRQAGHELDDWLRAERGQASSGTLI